VATEDKIKTLQVREILVINSPTCSEELRNEM